MTLSQSSFFSSFGSYQFLRRYASLNVAFGSQSGTAQALAFELSLAARKHNFDDVKVQSLNEIVSNFDSFDSPTPLVILISNFGVGEPPDNAKAFFDYIGKRSTPFNERVKYAIFGLGNSEYEGRFQHTGRVLDERFEKLGARKIVRRGEGDSAQGKNVEEQYETWESELWEALKNVDSTTTNTTATPSTATGSKSSTNATTGEAPKTERAVETRLLTDKEEATITAQQRTFVHPSPATDGVVNQYRPLEARVLATRELHGSLSQRHCAHVEFDLGSLTYETGDYLGVWPENDSEVVNRVLRSLNCSEQESERKYVTKILPAIAASHAQIPVSLREYLTRFVDLTRPAPRHLLRFIGAPVPVHQRAHIRSTADLIECINVENMLQYMSPMAARFYSITSGAFKYPHIVRTQIALFHIARATCADVGTCGAAMIRMPKAHIGAGGDLHSNDTRDRVYLGCSSGYLARLRPGDFARIFVVNSSFRVTAAQDNDAMIFVGNGTGIAPFRAFLMDRAARNAKGPTMLLYGCRLEHDCDFSYSDEIFQWERDNHVDLYSAYSGLEETFFVQHRVVEGDPAAARLRQLLSYSPSSLTFPRPLSLIVLPFSQRPPYNAKIYICGTPMMSEAFEKALNDLMHDAKYVETLRSEQRYLRDVFK